MSAIDKVYPLTALVEKLDQALETSGGEITPEVQAVQAQLAKLERVGDLANWYLRSEANVAAAKAMLEPLIEELQRDIRAAEGRRDYVETLLKLALPPGPESQFVSDIANVFYTESTSAEIIDSEAIPFEYQKVTTTPDRRAILAKLKDGKTQIPGATLKINYNLRVGHPGARAKRNAENRKNARAEKNVDLSNAIGEGKEDATA